MKIFVIDDEKTKRITTHDAIRKAGYQVESFSSPVFALKEFPSFEPDLVITDIRMPDLSGFDVLNKVKELSPSTSVVMMTAYGTVESAVEAMKLGAYDYITKPFSSEHLLIIIKKIEKFKKLERENTTLRQAIKGRYSFHNIIGKSNIMQDIYNQLESVAPSDLSVLIEGESGTGKEMVANAIHFNSERKDKPFVKLSCAVLNESILESELFGHEKGAFTGAYKSKKGRFEQANKGTLFLDDVDDIPMSFQVKLLRVLQEKEFERVGSSSPTKVDVRIISATKIDLWEKVQRGEFREDLFYRLRVIPINLPPLRKRKEDIPLLVNHFLEKNEKKGDLFSHEALEILSCYDWPGNIRQLENAVMRMAHLSQNKTITPDLIPPDIICKEKSNKALFNGNDKLNLNELLANMEIDALNWALEKANGNQSKAAEYLSIKRTTLRDKLKKHNILG